MNEIGQINFSLWYYMLHVTELGHSGNEKFYLDSLQALYNFFAMNGKSIHKCGMVHNKLMKYVAAYMIKLSLRQQVSPSYKQVLAQVATTFSQTPEESKAFEELMTKVDTKMVEQQITIVKDTFRPMVHKVEDKLRFFARAILGSANANTFTEEKLKFVLDPIFESSKKALVQE